MGSRGFHQCLPGRFGMSLEFLSVYHVGADNWKRAVKMQELPLVSFSSCSASMKPNEPLPGLRAEATLSRRPGPPCGRRTVALTTSFSRRPRSERSAEGTTMQRRGLGGGEGAVGACGSAWPGPEGTPLEERCLREDMETVSELIGSQLSVAGGRPQGQGGNCFQGQINLPVFYGLELVLPTSK